MDLLMSNYAIVVKKYMRDIAEGTMHFNRAISSCEMFRRNRLRNVRHIVNSLVRKSDKRKRRRRNTDDIPRMLVTVSTWWEIFVQERYPEAKCLQNFKCSRRTYFLLIKMLRPYIRPRLGVTPQRKTLNMIKGVSVEKQVAVVLYKLSMCANYPVMSGMFGIHKSTVHKIFYKVIMSINRYLLREVIRMPDEEEARLIAEHCKEMYGMPQVIGAIDFAHVPICPSLKGLVKYTNSKDYPSFVLQAVVDPYHCFRDISAKYPGSTEDRLILEDSDIYKHADRMIPSTTININGVDVSYKIVGSSSHPLLRWLLTEYRVTSTRKETLFNTRLKKIHRYAEETIAKLKARFTILNRSIDVNFKVAPQLISACCIIHNVCERNGDLVLQEWLDSAQHFIEKFPQPDRIVNKDRADRSISDERNTMRDYVGRRQTLVNEKLTCLKRQIVDLLTELN